MHLRKPVSGLKEELNLFRAGRISKKLYSVDHIGGETEKFCSNKMSLPTGILFCLMLVSIGLTVDAIAAETPVEKDSNAMETETKSEIKSRSDDPDFDELSSFFDFEIGPPSITYKDAEESNPKRTFHARPNTSKNYYYYHSDKTKKPYYHIPAKKVIVTPGTRYSPPTEKTFVEDDSRSEEQQPVLHQAKVGKYQVSVVDADSPLLSNLGLTPEDLKRLAGYEKSVANSSMVAADSTQSATYAESPRSSHQNSGYQASTSQSNPSYQPPYDTSNHPPPPVNYGERYPKPSESYHPSSSQNNNNDYNHDAGPRHPPPQGSYDPKSYREVQNGYHSNSNGYAPPYYKPSQSHNYNNPPQSHNYNNPPQSHNYNNPPPPPSNSYSSSHQAAYNHHQPSSSSSASYSPERSSGEPWRQVTQHHTDWDDSKPKKETWQSGSYPPHPPPLPYSSTSSNSGYHQKPSYAPPSEKTGHRLAATYVRPESKPSYSSSSGTSSYTPEYSSDRPHYSSSYSSSSKMPSRTGTVKIAASSPHHYSAPRKPGITIQFKAKSPSHSGVNIPVNFSALDLVKKIVPSLNPFNNKKITIGVTIENKDHHHTEIHPY